MGMASEPQAEVRGNLVDLGRQQGAAIPRCQEMWAGTGAGSLFPLRTVLGSPGPQQAERHVGWETWPSVPPSRPEHPKELEALSPAARGGPASLRRKTPRAKRGTFCLFAVTLNQGQTDAAGWDQRILWWGGAGQGTRKRRLGFL